MYQIRRLVYHVYYVHKLLMSKGQRAFLIEIAVIGG